MNVYKKVWLTALFQYYNMENQTTGIFRRVNASDDIRLTFKYFNIKETNIIHKGKWTFIDVFISDRTR